MTVKELIKELKKFPGDREVFTPYSDEFQPCHPVHGAIGVNSKNEGKCVIIVLNEDDL